MEKEKAKRKREKKKKKQQERKYPAGFLLSRILFIPYFCVPRYLPRARALEPSRPEPEL